jgi:hypothetical protein
VLAYVVLRYAELAGDLPVGQTGCDEAKWLTSPAAQRRALRVTFERGVADRDQVRSKCESRGATGTRPATKRKAV